MCWNKGRLCWKITKLLYFCHLKKLVRPETFGPYYVRASKTCGGVQVRLHKFLTSARSERLASHAGHFTPEKEAPVHIKRIRGGPRSRADVSEKRKISKLFSRLKHRISQPSLPSARKRNFLAITERRLVQSMLQLPVFHLEYFTLLCWVALAMVSSRLRADNSHRKRTKWNPYPHPLPYPSTVCPYQVP